MLHVIVWLSMCHHGSCDHLVGCTPINVCFNGDVMGSLPAMKKWFYKSPHTKHAQPLREVKRKEIFELAKQPTDFYRLIVELQVC